MFIEAQHKLKNGELVSRFINLSQISYIQEVKETNEHGHKSVLFTNNGFALYSQAEPKAILAWYQGVDDYSEQTVQNEYKHINTDH